MYRHRQAPITTTIVVAMAAMLCLPVTARGDEPATTEATASGTTGAAQPGGPVPYWQAPALPTAVIQGGAIPAGWQPQAVPYQGIGPDGRPLTMYFAPTYVFTYQSGPPVLATPTVTRRPPTMATSGWNFQAQGAPSVPMTLPPATVTRYQPPPYLFPPDSRALTGTPIAPPATPLPGPPPSASPQPPAPPPTGFAPAPTPPQPIAMPPAQWVPSNVLPPPGVTPQQPAIPQPGAWPQQGATPQQNAGGPVTPPR